MTLTFIYSATDQSSRLNMMKNIVVISADFTDVFSPRRISSNYIDNEISFEPILARKTGWNQMPRPHHLCRLADFVWCVHGESATANRTFCRLSECWGADFTVIITHKSLQRRCDVVFPIDDLKENNVTMWNNGVIKTLNNCDCLVFAGVQSPGVNIKTIEFWGV